MKIGFLSITVLLVVFASGCVPQKQIYYWGDYSSTLYDTKKDATDESILEHMTELQTLIQKSEELGKRIPPGICCEYGFYLLMSGEKEKALEYFNRESQLYPESKPFVSFLVSKSGEGVQKGGSSDE
ncbi:DUF4810 domain-containing protein [bacterium]|nr:DUF4810 domain-containing protein [bacterium]